jgi:hypothetical protein
MRIKSILISEERFASGDFVNAIAASLCLPRRRSPQPPKVGRGVPALLFPARRRPPRRTSSTVTTT